MGFFRQLQLLLWKNGLGVIRRPFWSVTLILWPVIIFLIIAVTRYQFPPVLKETCYVAPRNLPSTGLFPFLETLMCNTDSNCQNTSRLSTKQPLRARRETPNPPGQSPLSTLINLHKILQSVNPMNSSQDPPLPLDSFYNIFGVSQPQSMYAVNATTVGSQPINNLTESAAVLKNVICTLSLPMVNTSSSYSFTSALVTFCKSNNTVFEVAINTLNNILLEVMTSKPEEILVLAEQAVTIIDQLQNETSLWEGFLALPQIFSPTSPDQMFSNIDALLSNIQVILNIAEKNFPEIKANISTVKPFIVGATSLTQYIQNWPGKKVSIRLGDVVLENDTLWEMVRNIEIPLDKAIALTWDRNMVRDYVCNNSTNPMLVAACATGTLDMFLGWICPNKMAEQTLLAWSKYVAPHDLAFAKGLLHSLGGFYGLQGGSASTMTNDSMVSQPENTEEELFLEVGKVVMEVLQVSPEVHSFVQYILGTGFQSMKTATQALDSVEEMIENVLKDATKLQIIYQTLMTNQSQSSIWINQALDSVSESLFKTLASGPLTCETLLGPFEWLFSTESIQPEMWKAIICQNRSSIEQALLKDWLPLTQNVKDLYNALQGEKDYNITLPMILSEWHKLFNKSQHFGVLLKGLTESLGGAYWMKEMSENSTDTLTTSLQQSVPLFMVNLGQRFELSYLWPEAKNYFHMANWILNYKVGVTAEPNCSINMNSSAIECDTHFNWQQFVEAMTQALMSQSQEVLISCLKGSVNLLQHMYSDFYEYQAASYLNKTIQDGDMLSAFLINLMNELNDFTQNLTTLPDESISNPQIMVPLYQKLLESTGLTPLLPLILSDGPVNISQVLEVASQLGRSNQDIFIFNESDPTMPELEKCIMQFLSSEGNLTMSLYLSMGHTLLTYSNYFQPEYVAKLREAIQPFTNQTSAGNVEAILRAVELLKTIIDSPDGDPTQIILGYIRQLQEFLVSMFHMQRIEQFTLPDGQLSPAQVTDLQLLSDIVNLLNQETLLNLTEVGPDAAQDIIIQKYIESLPAEMRPEATEFLNKFAALQNLTAQCETGQNCLAGISEMFTFLDEILEMMLSTNENVTIIIAANNTYLGRKEYEQLAYTFFSLLLPPDDAAYVKTVQETLEFIELLTSQPNISVSYVQEALKQTNLTIEELNYIVTQLGARNVNDLIEKITGLINSQQCFEQEPSPVLTAQCAVGLVNGVSGFLTHLPSLEDEKSILSLIPLIVNQTVSHIILTNFSDPQEGVAALMNSTLENIKMTLHLNNLSTPEIMNEIKVLENLIKLAASTEPLKYLNTPPNPFKALEAPLEMVMWYLQRLENVTSDSSVSDLLYPLFRITEVQVAVQLAQLDLNNFISEKISNLTNSLQYPLDEDGVSKIDHTTMEILHHMLTFVIVNLEAQNAPSYLYGYEPPINMTAVNATILQMNYYSNLIQQWVTQPNVSGILSSMLTWNNTSNNISTPVNDIYHLLQTTLQFFTDDQLNYINAISNITQSLNKALMLAEEPNGLQSDHFLAAILEAIQNAMHVSMSETDPLPPSVQQNILEAVKNIIQLTANPEMSYSESLNTTLQILKGLELLVEQTVSEDVAQYFVVGLQIATTYFQSISTAMGPDNWNQMILNQVITVQSLLPPNCTAQTYISALINITHFILEPVQGNMSLWAVFEGASEENVPLIFVQIGKLLNIIWPIFIGGTGSPPTASSLKSFADLPLVLEQVMTNKANNDTWLKLQTMLEVMLSTIKETELSDNLSCVVELFENGIGNEVNILKAENELIVGLQVPVVTLMMEIMRSLNGSHFNMSEVSETLEVAIEKTLMASKQANGTLDCHEALEAWEPVRAAAGLAQSSMVKWCNISLAPVIDAYFEELKPHNCSCTDMGPVSPKAAAARIVSSVQSVYHADMTQSNVTDQFIEVFYSQLSALVDQPLSLEVERNLYKQLQDMQLQSSLSSVRALSEELQNKFPFLKPYTEALEKSLEYILKNNDQIQNSSSSEEFFSEAAMILLSSLNFTSDDIYYIISGNISNEAWVDMVTNTLKMMVDMKIFGDDPMQYLALEELLASNSTTMIMQMVTEMFSWFMSTQASGPDLLIQTLTKIHELLSHFLSALTQMNVDLPPNMLEDLTGSVISFIQQLLTTSSYAMDTNFNIYEQQMSSHNNTRVRRRREAPSMPVRGPMDDFIDLLSLNYNSMFQALMVPPTTEEIAETAHVFFSNPDLGIVMKGATKDMSWGLESSREDTIDAALGVASLLTVPGIELSSLDLWINAVHMLPDAFPYSSLLKNITLAIARESQDNLMQKILQTATALLQTNSTDPKSTELLSQLEKQVCSLEKTDSMVQLMQSLSLEPGLLCNSVLPILESLANTSTLLNSIFDVLIGDPRLYNVQTNWTSVLTEGLGLNLSGLSALNITAPPPGAVTIGEMVRNKTAFLLDLQQHPGFEPAVVYLLSETALSNNNLQILFWLVNMRHCNSTDSKNMTESEMAIFESFCSMSVEQWYSFSLILAQHLNMEKFLYRVMLPEEIQSLVQSMLHMAQAVVNMMKDMVPAINQLQGYLKSIEDLNLASNNEFREMSRSQRSTISSRATFVTISRALCSQGIISLFGIAQNPKIALSAPVFTDSSQREDMIERFKIPRNATPFCTNMYLDMVNTTGGAIAWAFLKPMLMGQILYTPDTPMTRDIMNKANRTLQEFANLRQYSQNWIESSSYIMKSSETLRQTLPMLQNSLGNAFVKNFIEMQTGINVDTMQETLSSFSNITLLLEKNKAVLNQITTLSTLMMDLSSCIKFDRHQGYDTEQELNTVAEKLAKDRNLYASVIFKQPEDSESSRKRRAPSTTYTLPPKVSYTIRMHMDNVMRTDRVREPFFVKDNHISSRQTLRYNRGFIYLQESIDRAIIELQTNQNITDSAVQLQPFPFPCYHRDEYLEAISFVFPLLLMIAWVLFVADFVKKLVHEREMKLHEYMKMMGVSPLSHFFAWFIESAAYLVLTIFFLTLVLKYGQILPNSNGFLIFLYICDYGLSILGFTYLVSSFFDKTYIAALSGSLLYVLSFFPFIVVMAMETQFSFSQKSLLSLFSPTCFSYASQYVTRYETQGEGIQWSNSYSSPIAGDTASFGWLCWLMLIDSILYFIIGGYIRMVFPGKTGIPAPWYFPIKASFWADLCCCKKSKSNGQGHFFSNIMQTDQPVFSDNKGKGKNTLSSRTGEDLSEMPVGVALHSLTKVYGTQVAIENLNISFHEGHVTSLVGHNGAGKTTTMSLLTGLFPPSSGTIEVYGRDMQAHLDDVRKELGVCMQYDVLFDHMTAKEHLLLYGQIKAPHWSQKQLHEQVRSILEETGMYAHRHKRVGTLSGGMKRKLSISIAFIGGSRLVVLDEPTTGVDPCSRRSIWDIVIRHKKGRTIIMSTHHLDEAEVLSDRIAFLERGGLKCSGTPFDLKDQLGQGYKLTLTKKNEKSKEIDNAELKSFVQAHIPEARLKEAQGSDLVYLLPPFSSSNASSYRSLLCALDTNLDALQLGCYGISDTTLEEVFLHLTHGNTNSAGGDDLMSISETVSDTVSDTQSIDSFTSDSNESTICFTGSATVSGVKLAWQQMTAILIKRFHHSRRDWKGLISQILLPVLFVVFAMGLGMIRSDLRHYPELKLSPALYNVGPSYSFFSNPNSSKLADTMLSIPGLDNACLEKSNNQACTRSTSSWTSSGNSSRTFSTCKCIREEEVCGVGDYVPPHKKIPSSQIVYNLTGLNVENYLVATSDEYIRNRYGGFDFGLPLPSNLQMDVKGVPQNRTLSKVWFNPEGHHTMPAYLSSLNNFILRSNLPADKDPSEYGLSVSSHPYFGRPDDEDSIVQGMLQILVAMCVLAGYSITTSSFAIYEVNEHHSGSKRLQLIAGVSEPFYWAVNFFYDMVIYLIPVALTVGVIAAFQIPAFTERQNLGAVTLLLVLFGFATFPWMYLLSGVLKDAEMAFITYVCINLFICVNTIIPTSILYFMGQITQRNAEALKVIFDRLSYAFLIFPQFNFGNGLLALARMNIEVQILSGYGIDAYKNPFSTDALGWMFISSFIQGVVFFSLRLLLNKYTIRKLRHLILRRKTIPLLACEDEDEDVAAEHCRVSSGAACEDVLQMNQLTKVYQHLKKKVPAVKQLSLGVPAGECFGLLGVNGAGKTTTFKMLTGDVSPTDGTAQIRDRDGRLVDIMECRNQGINIGYCPQDDGLDELLTGEEHLYFYSRLHGISKRDIPGAVNYLLRRLELDYYRNTITDGYSCGTRRKLSTALALVGHPQILLLDEPSSGMDPRTKRHLWKIISEEVKGKCAVVLTSHSMEECEALCGRLAIMVKGQFRCLGSLQHIKNRFGSGFTVKMYLAKASSDAEAITSFMQSHFPCTYLKDQHSTMVEYHVPLAPGGVAEIFSQLESNKNYLEIQHFSVSQTTLDEVFINFAMGKIGTETIPLDEEHDDVSSMEDAEA